MLHKESFKITQICSECNTVFQWIKIFELFHRLKCGHFAEMTFKIILYNLVSTKSSISADPAHTSTRLSTLADEWAPHFWLGSLCLMAAKTQAQKRGENACNLTRWRTTTLVTWLASWDGEHGAPPTLVFSWHYITPPLCVWRQRGQCLALSSTLTC